MSFQLGGDFPIKKMFWNPDREMIFLQKGYLEISHRELTFLRKGKFMEFSGVERTLQSPHQKRILVDFPIERRLLYYKKVLVVILT